MFDPVTATVLAVAATAVTATGQIIQGRQQKKAAEYNAKIAEQNATAARKKAEFDEQMHRDRVRQMLSKQRSLVGKSGLELSGSSLLALEETAKTGEIDALAIRYGGEVAAGQQTSIAARERMAGRQAQTAGYMQAGSTLLTGASRIAQINTPPKK